MHVCKMLTVWHCLLRMEMNADAADMKQILELKADDVTTITHAKSHNNITADAAWLQIRHHNHSCKKSQHCNGWLAARQMQVVRAMVTIRAACMHVAVSKGATGKHTRMTADCKSWCLGPCRCKRRLPAIR